MDARLETYIYLVKKGLKALESIPEKYRAEVEARLGADA